jgi:arylsulfatase A-like enzyme
VNTPLRGNKQLNYEGGVRTPFIVSWPARYAGGRILDTPVISLDILATALDAAGLPGPTDQPLDGKSLLPVLAGGTAHHDHFFWSEGGSSGEWAVRSGKWKLVAHPESVELYDLEADLAETTDLAAKYPEVVAELQRLYDGWLDEMAAPLSGANKRWEPSAATPARKRNRNKEGEEG